MRWTLRAALGTLATLSVNALGHACLYGDPRARPIDAGVDSLAAPSDASEGGAAPCVGSACAPAETGPPRDPCPRAAAADGLRLVTGAGPPPARSNARMAFDPSDGSLLLFGGMIGWVSGGSTTATNDTWRLTNTEWTALDPPTKPPARYDHAMTTDAKHGRVYLFGGMGPSPAYELKDDLWEWDGRTWTELCVSTACRSTRPTPRTTAGLAYDPARERLVVMGGRETGGPANDTWEWDGAGWSIICGKGRIDCGFIVSEALFGGATYDPARRRTVFLHEHAPSLTYEYDGARWTLATSPESPPFPGGSFGHVMGTVYDPVRRAVVALGHSKEADLRVWEWDGKCWSNTTPGASPTGTAAHQAVAYDPRNERIVRMGGFTFGDPGRIEREVFVRPSR